MTNRTVLRFALALLLTLFCDGRYMGDELHGTFVLESGGPAVCPRMIEHKKVIKLDMMKYYIMSEDVSHDDETCIGGELLNIVLKTNKPARIPPPSEPASSSSKDNLKFAVSPSTVFTVRTADPNEGSGDFILRKLTQQKEDPFFYGHALGPRMCGSSAFTRNTLYFFAQPSKDLEVHGVTLRKDVKYMLVQLEEESRPCVYVHYYTTIFTDT